jgi:Phosphotransferase enzyme family
MDDDRPAAAECTSDSERREHQAMPEEMPLSGGFVNDVVRVGETVRRSAGPWTPAVHELLSHLQSAGFKESPRPMGIDDRGREVLSFIPGDTIGWTDWPKVLRQPDGAHILGSLLRSYHNAASTFEPDPDLRWRNPLAPRSGEIIRHGDFSPFNTVWVQDRPVGVIDWDFAQPGKAIDDLAYLAWQLVPLQPDERGRQYGLAEGFNRADRMDALCQGYGGDFTPGEVIAGAVSVIETEIANTRALAASGIHPWTLFEKDGAVAAFAGEAQWIRQTYRI